MTTSVMNRRRTVIKSFVLLVVLVAVGVWLSSSVLIVDLHEVAVYQRLGETHQDLLEPGIHFVLPHPFSKLTRVNVRRVKTLSVGFDAHVPDLTQAPLLWTQEHGLEYPVIVGEGTEIAVVNGLVQFKVKEDADSVRSYAVATSDPSRIVQAVSQQVLQDHVCGVSAAELLSIDRQAFAHQLQAQIQTELDNLSLGVEVVGFRVLGIHPPVEVSYAYLDVVNATIDADRDVEVSRKNAASEIVRCEMMSASDVADARAAGQRELQLATERIASYGALQGLYQSYETVYRWVLLSETLRDALANQPLVLLDKDLPNNAQVWLGDHTDTESSGR